MIDVVFQTAVHVSRDFMGCSALKKYYSQLSFLQSRFPMRDGGDAAVIFTWYRGLFLKFWGYFSPQTYSTDVPQFPWRWTCCLLCTKAQNDLTSKDAWIVNQHDCCATDSRLGVVTILLHVYSVTPKPRKRVFLNVINL